MFSHFSLTFIFVIIMGECYYISAICTDSKNPKEYETYCYRTYNGSYNNLEHPEWGNANIPYNRLITKFPYIEGKDGFPQSVTGGPLPLPRTLSLNIFPDVPIEMKPWTETLVSWGQSVAHDISLTFDVPQTNVGFIECCTGGGQYTQTEYTNPRCNSIVLPPDDPYNGPEGKKCINFYRTGRSGPNDTCVAPNEPKTSVTSFLDLSIVYDNSQELAYEIREFKGGRLKVYKEKGKEYPPLYEDPGSVCDLKNISKNYCLHTGDVRGNQNLPLALLQIILVRTHNAIADMLCQKINRHWNDEKCYQESRRILIAVAQHITYYEFLSIILGKQNLIKRKIIYENPVGYINDYDPHVNPTALNEHSTAAYRFFHSTIQGQLSTVGRNRCPMGQIRLTDWMDNTSILFNKSVEEDLVRGQLIQNARKAGRFCDSEITQFLFKFGNLLGQDLRAIDIKRSRDHNLPSYTSVLSAFGFNVTSFDDFKELMPDEYAELLKREYKSPEDVDLVVGGTLETPRGGSQAGPTFTNIILEQLYRSRVGDRFFFESGTQPCPFTPEQLSSIRKGSSLAALYCDHVPGLNMIQRRAFEEPSEDNPLVPCRCIPKIDLLLWRDKSYFG